MPKRTSQDRFDGSAARNLQPENEPIRLPARMPQSTGHSELPDQINQLRAEQKREEEEVSGIRKKIRGDRTPSPGASAMLAIERARSLFDSGKTTAESLERVTEELRESKRALEDAVATLRARGSDAEATSEYFSLIMDAEELLDVAEHHLPNEVEEAWEEAQSAHSPRINELKLELHLDEKRREKMTEVRNLKKELTPIKTAFEEAAMDRELDSEAEQKRLAQVFKKGGWALLTQKVTDGFRSLIGQPSLSGLYQKMQDLQSKISEADAEAIEAAHLKEVSPEKGKRIAYRPESKKPRTPKAEIRREEQRREDRLAAKQLNEQKGVQRMEDFAKEMDVPLETKSDTELKKEADEEIWEDVDLSDLEAAPSSGVHAKTERADVTVPEEITKGAQKAAKKMELDFDDMEDTVVDRNVPPKEASKPLELDFSDLDEAAEKEKQTKKKGREIPAPPESLQKEAKAFEERLVMNTEKAMELVPNAELLWYKVNNKMNETTAKKINEMEFGPDVAQTKFVFLVARYLEAKKNRAGAAELRKLRQNAEKAAAILKMNTDPAFLEAMGMLEKPSASKAA